MQSIFYEKAFENLLESEGYDSASEALFSLARAAFAAGWKAAESLYKSQDTTYIKDSLRTDEHTK